jgi:pilus assembly protein CpaB
MSFRSIIVILLAAVCGIASVIAILSTTSMSAKTTVETTKVVVAATEIRRGDTVNPRMLKTVDWPKDLVPPGTVMDIEKVVDRTAMQGILPEELVLEAKVATGDSAHGLSPFIRDGMRAFTILTPSDASGVAGFILPGNRVDVVLAVSGGDEATGGATATTLLQNIEVLAVGQQLEAPRENRMELKEMRSVTLSVNPDQAAKLSLAQTKGTLHLSLRGDLDDLTAKVDTVTLKELRFLQLPGENLLDDVADEETTPVTASVDEPPPAPVVRRVFHIRSMRGTTPGMVNVIEGKPVDRS